MVGLALPGFMIVKVAGFSGAGLIAVFAGTLLLPVIAGLTIPYPRSLWNVPVVLQLGEIASALWSYFEFQDVLAKSPAAGQVILAIALFRIIAILWLYVANSAVAAWLLCIYQGIQIVITAAGIALAVFYRHEASYLPVYALLFAQGMLRAAAIYLMLRALGKVREFRRPAQAAPQQPAAPDGVWR